MRHLAYGLMTFLVMGICGCGDDVGTPINIKGKVTLNGQPMQNARIGFAAISEGLPAKYRYKSTETAADGTYAIEDMYEAEYMVQVTPAAMLSTEADAEKAAIVQDPVVIKYGQESPLRAQIAADKTEFNFDLTTE